MVLSLEPDATLAPNPTSGKPVTREGPLRQNWLQHSPRPAKVLCPAAGGRPRGRVPDG